MRRAVVSRKLMETAVRPLVLATSAHLRAEHLAILRASFGTDLAVVRDLTTWGASGTNAHAVDACTPLALGLFPLESLREYRAFERNAHSIGMSALSLALQGRLLLLGPMSTPGVPGCGYCARRRMAAARAARIAMGDADEDGASLNALRDLTQAIRAMWQRPRSASYLRLHVAAVDCTDASARRHRFVPMPHCELCGGAASMRAVRSTRGLAGWVDPLTGVISSVSVDSPSERGLESPIVVTAAPPHVVSEDGTVRRLPVGWGKGLVPADAVLSAVGEAIERYAASLADPSKTIETRPADLDGPHLDPQGFALYSSEQYGRPGFPFVPYDPRLEHPWVRGRSLSTGEPIWVHAAFAHLTLKLRRHQLIVQGSSNGLAASTTFEDAARRAILELVERDAFMCSWLTRAPGRRVILDDSLDPQLQTILTGLQRSGAEVEVYLLDTSAIGTTALCLSMGDGRQWPGATLALGADLNPVAAIRSALLEMGQTGPHLRRLMRQKMWSVPTEERAVRDMLDHAAYYFPVQRRHHFDSLRHGGQSVSLTDLETAEVAPSLAVCRAAIAAAGIEVAVVDVTSPDVRTGPFRVARAISPDLQSISYGFGFDRLPVVRIAQRCRSRVEAVHPVW